MGKEKYRKRLEAFFEKSLVVRFADIQKIVCEKRDSGYAKQLVHELLASGKILKLIPGYYTKYREIGLSVLCFSPAYIGLQSALSYHGIWEQETISVILTTKTVRQGLRKSMGANILVRKMQRRYFFGYTFVDDAGYYLPYSDIEKTFIDFFVYREKLSFEVLKEFQKRISVPKLKKYLAGYPKIIRVKVLNALERKVSPSI